ncbi:MAG: bacterio-opsin activator domain-containing protein [Halobacteriales archaeon]|nr:bacterio-opsin activator domain-containing protein [Halobacteriales archaeon]
MAAIALRDVLAVFENQHTSGTPLTAPEVADALDCTRRTAHKKLTKLAEQDVLRTKKVGARGRIWWRPVEPPSSTTALDTDSAPADRRERPAHRQALRELHDASRELMRAETHESVANIAVEAAQRILGLPLNGLWRYDPDRDVLEPIAWTDPGAEEFGPPPAFPIDDSLVGQAFQEGAFRVYDDVRTEEGLYDPDTRVRSELILPLGEHGVLNASSLAVGSFDAIDVSLGRILAANVETALERADQLEARRARRRELRRQRDELDRLNQINALIEQTIGALIEAATRDEIEETVQGQLAASTVYADAWIIERDTANDTVVSRAGSDLDWAVTDPAESETHTGAIVDAIETREVRAVSIPVDPDRSTAPQLPSSTASLPCLVVPLAYADTVFGALLVAAPEAGQFSDRERTAFETLGRVVGFVINATNNRQLLVGNTAVELEVALRNTDVWFLAAADHHDTTVRIEGVIPTTADTVVAYVRVDGTEEATPSFETVADSIDTRVLATSEDSQFLECTIHTEAGLRRIVEYGATIQTAKATDGHATITARFPATTSPREAMALIEEAFPDPELNAKRVVDLSDRSLLTIRQRLTDRLTEKQLAALRAAFLAGYYARPRRTSAQDLAASLDIAPATLHQHLQAAHRKVLDAVLADVSIDDAI